MWVQGLGLGCFRDEEKIAELTGQDDVGIWSGLGL